MPKRRQPKGPDIPEWVVTYGDLMSLLLCFFILLAAFSELKQPREYQRVIDAIREALGVTGGDSSILDELQLASAPLSEDSAFQPDRRTKASASDTNQKSVPGPDSETAKLMTDARWTVGQPIPFDAGSELIDEPLKQALREQLAPKIRGSDYKFIVAGHAWGPDDRISGLGADDLSFRRAKAIKDYLVSECEVNPNLLGLYIAGDSQPLAREQLGAAGEAGNRRVEIFQTGVTLDALHPDPMGTGRGK